MRDFVAPCPHLPPQFGVRKQPPQTVLQSGGVSHGNQESVLAVANQRGNAAHIRTHDGHTRSHGLQYHPPHALLSRWERKNGGFTDDIQHIRMGPGLEDFDPGIIRRDLLMALLLRVVSEQF